jgi:hypothetical protein
MAGAVGRRQPPCERAGPAADHVRGSCGGSARLCGCDRGCGRWVLIRDAAGACDGADVGGVPAGVGASAVLWDGVCGVVSPVSESTTCRPSHAVCVCVGVWDTGEGHAVDVRSADCRVTVTVTVITPPKRQPTPNAVGPALGLRRRTAVSAVRVCGANKFSLAGTYPLRGALGIQCLFSCAHSDYDFWVHAIYLYTPQIHFPK